MSDAPPDAAAPAVLSPRQRDVLDYIAEHCGQHGRPPTFREIAFALAYKSVGSVQSVTRVLLEKGHLVNQGHARGLIPASFVRARQTPSALEREALVIEAELWCDTYRVRGGDEGEKVASLLARVVQYLRTHDLPPQRP